jgi:hypothetical protein
MNNVITAETAADSTTKDEDLQVSQQQTNVGGSLFIVLIVHSKVYRSCGRLFSHCFK